MRFASCRINNGELLICSFIKEYNKCSFEKVFSVPMDESHEILKEYDYIDFVLPGKDILYYSRNYPPVNEVQLRKIVSQDIESDTPFLENDVMIEVKASPLEATKVFCVPKEIIRSYLNRFDQFSKEKIRSIVPEEFIAFKCFKETEKAIFIGDTYSLFIADSGQVVKNGGTAELKKDLISLFGGDDPEEDLRTWLNASVDISSTEDLSDIELRIKKCVQSFLEKTVSYFIPFSGTMSETTIFINDIVPEGTAKIAQMLDSSPFSEKPFVVVAVKDFLEMTGIAMEKGIGVNFAKKEFAYKGGFSFLKKRIIFAAVLYITAIVLLISGMQLRIRYLNQRAASIDERTRTVMIEVLGREYPSLRQAISVMNQTIRGEQGASDRQIVYPYSALHIMEAIFPLIAYEDSTIEISELAIREEGRIRIAGTANTLDDINKLTENLSTHDMISELSRGQINTRGDKSSFNVTFEYAQPKKADSRTQKARKKSGN